MNRSSSLPVFRVVQAATGYELREVRVSADGDITPVGSAILTEPSLNRLRDLAAALADATARPVLANSEPDDPWEVADRAGWWGIRHRTTGRFKRVGRVHEPGCRSRINYRHRANELAAERNRRARRAKGRNEGSGVPSQADFQTLAERAFEHYDFGEHVHVLDSRPWDVSDQGEYVKTVFVEFADDRPSDPERVINFRVRFDAHGALSDVVALDADTGNEIGFPGPSA